MSLGQAILDGLNSVPKKEGKFLKLSDVRFLVEGRILKVAADVELFQPSSPKYGFQDGPNKGMSARYTFSDEGVEKILETSSKPFLAALNASGAAVGDTVQIKRIGSGFSTDYMITVLNR